MQIDFSTGTYEDNFKILSKALERQGFVMQEPKQSAGDAAVPVKITPKKSPLSKIPTWGWVVGAVVLLLVWDWEVMVFLAVEHKNQRSHPPI